MAQSRFVAEIQKKERVEKEEGGDDIMNDDDLGAAVRVDDDGTRSSSLTCRMSWHGVKR